MRRAGAIIGARDLDRRKIVDRVALDQDHRYRRRLVLQTAGGDSVLLDLIEARQLRHGDGLLLEDGSIVLVEALPETLIEIRAPHPTALIRIAWHLGNRHVPTQLHDESLWIREDHVIAEMVHRLGGMTTAIRAAFDPVGGAYGGDATAHHRHLENKSASMHGHSHDRS